MAADGKETNLRDLAQRMRILHIATRLNVGGISEQIISLATDLDPTRFDCRLAVGTPRGHDGDILALRADLQQKLGDRMVRLPGLERGINPIHIRRAYRAIGGLIAEFRPDIVHTSMAHAGLLGRLAAFRDGDTMTVHTFHGTIFEGHFIAPVGHALAVLERLLARRTDRIIAISRSVAGRLAGYRIGSGKIEVVPVGLDLERFSSVPPPSQPIPKVVALVARLVPVKDVPLFITALIRLKSRIPELQAVIVGDGHLRPRLEAMAPRWVSFLGHRTDLPEVLAGVGVVVLTSRSEGSPVSLLEALAASRPVVAVPVGGVNELLDGRGGAVVTEDRSPDAIAFWMERALMEPDLSSGASAERARVIKEFSRERLVSDMESVYERLAAERK